ncbi:MAG: hypothetical protein D6767_07270 [Candidatus Hydrogenedentota bacterium]|nr:MAG: hypothetical protein D6767_07270 [Candidatus Hydrogenedentota bacterium]
MSEVRFLYFDLIWGNSIALDTFIRRFGIFKSIKIILAVEWNLMWNHPFRELNKENPPDLQAKLSQKQMAPLIVLDKVLQKENYSKEERLAFLSELSAKVAKAFLNFNIPALSYAVWQKKTRYQKERFLHNLVNRFFNAKGEAKLSDDEQSFEYPVNFCYFAYYAHKLNVIHLGKLFCQTDKLFFEEERPEVQFYRSKTLMEGKPYCDFRFQWKSNNKYTSSDSRRFAENR